MIPAIQLFIERLCRVLRAVVGTIGIPALREVASRFAVAKIHAVVLSAAIATILAGCEEEGSLVDPDIEQVGSIFVQVVDENDNPVVGATVFTNPVTERDTTGSMGTVMLEDITPGTYTVIASMPGYGAGSRACWVQNQTPSNVDIKLQEGSFIGPDVRIMSEGFGREYSYVDTVPLAASVTDDIDPPDSIGAVWVSSRDGQLGEAAVSAEGQVTLAAADLSIGHHLIYLWATDTDSLIGRDTISIDVVSYAPVAQVATLPAWQDYAVGDTINLSATVVDHESGCEAVSVRWTSDRDGVIFAGHPDSTGFSMVKFVPLTKAVHTIEVEAIDHDGNRICDTAALNAVLPRRVQMAPPEKYYEQITLRWTKSDDTDFARYIVCRGSSYYPSDSIAAISNADSLTYCDLTGEPGRTYNYYLRVVDAAGHSSASNGAQVEAGEYIAMGVVLSRMIVDYGRNLVYALSGPTNQLIIIDPVADGELGRLYVGDEPVDMDIDESGDTLYIANFGATEIAVVDLVSRTLVRTILLPRHAYRVECARQGRLVYVDEDQWCTVTLLNTSTGAMMDGVGYVYQPDIEVSFDRLTVYAGESGISSGNILDWSIVGDTFRGLPTPGYGLSYPPRGLVMDYAGEYIYYGQRKFPVGTLAAILGTMPGRVYALSRFGTTALTSAGLASTETYMTTRPMNGVEAVCAITADDRKLLLYDSDTKRVYIVTMGIEP